MWLIIRPVLLCVTFLTKCHSYETATQSNIEVVQPLTYGSALQAEVQRLQSVTPQVFPPKGFSYFIPYGDRTVVVTQFPSIASQDIRQQGYSSAYGPPRRSSASSKRDDFGVIISQNFLYKQNLRDYGNFAKVFENSRPSQEILEDVGKLLAVKLKEKREQSGSLDKVLSILSQDGWGAPPTPKKGSPSFALVVVESRVKVSGSSSGHLSLTNGSIIFPSADNPQVLKLVPFVLKESGDVRNVFKGYEEDMKGLVPQERKKLLSFLKLVEGIHEDAHVDGKDRLGRVRRLSSSLTKPRLPITNLLQDDPLEAQEDLVRDTYWLYSSTVALRTLTSTPRHNKKYYGPPKKKEHNNNLGHSFEVDLSLQFPEGDVYQNSYGDLPPSMWSVNSHFDNKPNKAYSTIF